MKISAQLRIPRISFWPRISGYYHAHIAHSYKYTIPAHQRVLHISSKEGSLLQAVKPHYGVGIEADESLLSLARTTYPHYEFYNSLENLPLTIFDYVIVSSAVMEVYDIQKLFTDIYQHCNSSTKIIIDFYSPWWEPVLWIAQKLGLRKTTSLTNWITRFDIECFLSLAHFQTIKTDRSLLIPIYIPFISWFFNAFIAKISGINRLCLLEWVIARPCLPNDNPNNTSVSVIVPCKNERGNIEPIINNCPAMGKFTEIIFVEGGSADGTLEEIKRVSEKYPDKKIRYFIQEGKGKGDAVRKGFSHAQGDVLMILDADLTVPAEELTLFFNALIQGKGEFINGSRLVYGMESEAMRFLNLIANHFFGLTFSWLLGQRIKDTLCGTKVLYKKDYQKIEANRSYFGNFDPFGDFDLLFGAAHLNLKIIDMPVHYKKRVYGTTQIRRFYHGFLLLKMSFFALRKCKFR